MGDLENVITNEKTSNIQNNEICGESSLICKDNIEKDEQEISLSTIMATIRYFRTP